jgi:hypothetical protein
VQIQATFAPSRISCSTLGCKSTRIRRDCGRRASKAHCLEAGGCQSPAHRGSTTEMACRNHPLLPLTPPVGGASFNDRVGTSFQHVRHATPTNSALNRPRSSSHSSSSSDLGSSTLSLNRRTRPPSLRFAHVLDFHRTMGDRAAAQGGTTRTRFRLFAKPSEDKKHHFGVCMDSGMLLVPLSFLSLILY